MKSHYQIRLGSSLCFHWVGTYTAEPTRHKNLGRWSHFVDPLLKTQLIRYCVTRFEQTFLVNICIPLSFIVKEDHHTYNCLNFESNILSFKRLRRREEADALQHSRQWCDIWVTANEMHSSFERFRKEHQTLRNVPPPVQLFPSMSEFWGGKNLIFSEFCLWRHRLQKNIKIIIFFFINMYAAIFANCHGKHVTLCKKN